MRVNQVRIHEISVVSFSLLLKSKFSHEPGLLFGSSSGICFKGIPEKVDSFHLDNQLE